MHADLDNYQINYLILSDQLSVPILQHKCQSFITSFVVTLPWKTEKAREMPKTSESLGKIQTLTKF